MVGTAFDSAEEAFSHLVKRGGLATLLEELMPGRCTSEDLQALWQALSRGSDSLTREAFTASL